MVGVFKTTHLYLELLGSGAESEGEKCLHERRWFVADLKLVGKWSSAQTECVITETI